MYAATVNGQHLTFQVYGVWRKNMVIRDKQTGTIWQQATGEAIDGPLKGQRLEVLTGWETTWGVLRMEVPGASFVQAPRKFTGLIPKPVLEHMLGISHRMSLSGLSAADTRLSTHQIVVGVVINGAAKAYPLDTLRAQPDITDQVGGEIIRLMYDPAGDQVMVSTADGARIQSDRQWWLGWSEFHPRSEIYGAKADARPA